jgi:intracellular septation protein
MLILDIFQKKLYLKQIFEKSFTLSDDAWLSLSKRFAVYFIFIAILNEVIWRYQSEAFWVNFKIFGMAPITFIFMAFQIPFIYRNQIK